MSLCHVLDIGAEMDGIDYVDIGVFVGYLTYGIADVFKGLAVVFPSVCREKYRLFGVVHVV